MSDVFLGQPSEYIKNFFINRFYKNSWPSYTTLKFVDGTTQTKEISGTATWENIGVKSDQWYEDNTLKSCQLGNKVTEISTDAFCDCKALTSINIPNSVTSIGDGALSNCISLTSIDIPSSVTSIGHFAFMYCSSLTAINIPNSITSIGDYEFRYCLVLSSINIPDSVTLIGNNAFYDCSSLTSIIFEGKTMPEITSMENYPWGIEEAISVIIPGIS